MTDGSRTGVFVVWLVLLSAVSGFLLVENGILRNRFAPPTEGEVLFAEARIDVLLDAEGMGFTVTGSRLATPSHFDGPFRAGPTVRPHMTGAGFCVWSHIEYRLAQATNNLTDERVTCRASGEPLVVAQDGLGGRWVVGWSDPSHLDVWGDARQFGVDQGQEVVTSVFGEAHLPLSSVDDGVHYGPWTFRGSLTWVNHGRVAWQAL